MDQAADFLAETQALAGLLAPLPDSAFDEATKDPEFLAMANKMGLMIRPAAGKRGQKGMMNIDHRPAEIFQEISRQNLHITGEHHKFYARRTEDF